MAISSLKTGFISPNSMLVGNTAYNPPPTIEYLVIAGGGSGGGRAVSFWRHGRAPGPAARRGRQPGPLVGRARLGPDQLLPTASREGRRQGAARTRPAALPGRPRGRAGSHAGAQLLPAGRRSRRRPSHGVPRKGNLPIFKPAERYLRLPKKFHLLPDLKKKLCFEKLLLNN